MFCPADGASDNAWVTFGPVLVADSLSRWGLLGSRWNHQVHCPRSGRVTIARQRWSVALMGTSPHVFPTPGDSHETGSSSADLLRPGISVPAVAQGWSDKSDSCAGQLLQGLLVGSSNQKYFVRKPQNRDGDKRRATNCNESLMHVEMFWPSVRHMQSRMSCISCCTPRPPFSPYAGK
jgi:hypothetical protein